MTTRRRRRRKSLSEKCVELAVAVPQVIAHRAARAALSAPSMSQRDRREFSRMVNEKPAAYVEAWWAMTLQLVRGNQGLITLLMHAMVNPLSVHSAASSLAQAQRAMMSVLDKGVAPVHRRVVMNAKRLSKTPLR
jgi:hypothetical protein